MDVYCSLLGVQSVAGVVRHGRYGGLKRKGVDDWSVEM